MQTQATGPSAAAATNGLAIAALVLGVVGAVFGLIPLTGFIAIICGVLAIAFGIPAWRAARVRGRRAMAIAGTILGVIALALGVWGTVIVADAASDLDRELDKLEQQLDQPQP